MTMVPGHGESLLPPGKRWQLVWHDEFEGSELDRSKWMFRKHLFHRQHETFTDEGVFLDGNSNLHITLLEKDGHYYSAHLQTGENYMDRPHTGEWPIAALANPTFMHKYGYYECRCKLPTQKGWWAAFWLQSPVIGSSLDPRRAGVEVDILETFSDYGVISSTTISHNCHWGGYGPDHRSSGLVAWTLKETPDGFHHFGVDWSPTGYVFYVDGEETNRMEEAVSDTEQFILLSTECDGYRNEERQPSEDLRRAMLPDAFIVDFVRVYDSV